VSKEADDEAINGEEGGEDDSDDSEEDMDEDSEEEETAPPAKAAKWQQSTPAQPDEGINT
jgi:hypothetical protein